MDPVDADTNDPMASVVRMMQGDSSMAKTSDTSSVLGPRLRAIRLRRGLSLRELARRVDLSPSSISQIETGKMQPSVRTLYALVSEFGITVDEVLFEHAPPLLDGASASESSAAVAGPGLAVQRVAERPAITLNSGVTWERLMFWGDEDVEFIEATYEPGGASGMGVAASVTVTAAPAAEVANEGTSVAWRLDWLAERSDLLPELLEALTT